MQFIGYLRRNPNDSPDSDYSRYDFWPAKLNQFNGNFVDAEMVKAFITSGEDRQRLDREVKEHRAKREAAYSHTRTYRLALRSLPIRIGSRNQDARFTRRSNS